MRPKKHSPTGKAICSGRGSTRSSTCGTSWCNPPSKLDWEGSTPDRPALQRRAAGDREAVRDRASAAQAHLRAVDEEVCARWVENPYFQHFTGEEFFQHAFPHERSDLTHWRKRLGDKLDRLLAESLRVAHERVRCATRTSSGSPWTPRCSRRR